MEARGMSFCKDEPQRSPTLSAAQLCRRTDGISEGTDGIGEGTGEGTGDGTDEGMMELMRE